MEKNGLYRVLILTKKTKMSSHKLCEKTCKNGFNNVEKSRKRYGKTK
jgi:hypothetical protein